MADFHLFASRLLGDENKVASDDRRLQRDTSKEDAAMLGAKLGVSPDVREASNSPMALGTDFFSSGNSGVNSPLGSPDQGAPSRPAPDFRQQLLDAAGGPARGGPVALPSAAVPQQQVDLSGMHAPSGGPMIDLSGGPGARLSPGQIDQRFSGGPGAASNVDLSGMSAPGAAAGPGAGAGQMTLSQPSYQPPTTVAAHWDTSRLPDKPGTRQAMFRDEADMSAAQQAEMAAQRRQNMIAANNMQKEADDAQDRLAHRQVENDQRYAYVAERGAQLDKLIHDTATSKEDPNRIFNNADTGTKVLLGIGAFFGGLIPGVAPLMKMLGGSIQADIEAQRQDKHGRQVGIDQAQKALGDVRGDMRDRRQDDLADEMQQWTVAQQHIKAQMARTNDPILKAQGEQALAASQGRITALRSQWDRIQHVNSYTIGGGGGGKPPEPQLLIRMPDGSTRVAPTKESYHDATRAIGFTQNIRSNIDKALAIRKAASALDLANPLSAVSKKLVSLQKDTEQLVTVRRGQGAMSAGDEKVAQGALGSFDSFWNGSANEAVMRGASEREGQHLEGDVNALGAERVDPGYVYDRQGRLVPNSEYVGAADKPAAGRPKSGKPISR